MGLLDRWLSRVGPVVVVLDLDLFGKGLTRYDFESAATHQKKIAFPCSSRSGIRADRIGPDRLTVI